MKAVICAIAKFEYNYIYEWVEYHLNLGFDKIVIYDNNDEDGETYDTLLSEFIKKGQVELRDVRGKRAMQRVVYNEFYHEGDFDWVAIIDIDEFISPNRTKYKNIKEFIESNSNADAIFLYWQTYGDSGKTYPVRTNPRKNNKPISILNQYSVPANKESLIDNAMKIQNAWGKSIIKGGLNIEYLHEHFVTNPSNLNYVDCFGDSVSPYLFFPDKSYVESTYKECYIKHIYTKSLSEYIDCKVRRPAANAMGIMHFPSKYFKVNEINEEKRKYLESIGYKMEFVFKPDVYCVVEIKNLEEYYKLKPYILNIIDLCCCRLDLCVTEDEAAVSIIDEEIGSRFNECCIYYHSKHDVLLNIMHIFEEDRRTVINHTNCIVHINIPYNVDIDKYIDENIDPIFCKENIKRSFTRVFNTDGGIYVPETSIVDINKTSSGFIKFKEILEKNGYDAKITYYAETGVFIMKTNNIINTKVLEFIKNNKEYFTDPEFVLYFISNIFDSFLFTKINN